MDKLLSKLSKSEILSLPEFDRYTSKKVKELKPLSKKSIKDLRIDFRGVLVSDYVNKVEENRKADEDLFQRISSLKDQRQSHEQYKQTLKDNALFDCSFMSIDTGYKTSKTEERLHYEENVHDKAEYQKYMKRMIITVKNHESFEVDIDDDTKKQYAFTKVLRQQRSSEWKPIV